MDILSPYGLTQTFRKIMAAHSFDLQMTQTHVSGLGMNMVSARTSRDTLARNVPYIRLEDDADLRVRIASFPDSTAVLCCAMRPPLKKSHILTGDLYSILLSAPEEDQTSLCCCIAPLHWGI